MLLFYIRHGEPIYDPDSLTPLGQRQAESVAHRLCLFGIDRVFTSTSTRAIETARPTCDILRIKPEAALDWMNEANVWRDLSVEFAPGRRHWAYDDDAMTELFASPEIRRMGHRWHEHRAFEPFPAFGEAVRRMRREADAWLESLGYRHDGESCSYHVAAPTDERVALFAHEGAGLLLLSTILDIPYPMFAPSFAMCHTGMTVIEFRNRGGACTPRVLELSNDAHLYRDGLPLNYQRRIRF